MGCLRGDPTYPGGRAMTGGGASGEGDFENTVFSSNVSASTWTKAQDARLDKGSNVEKPLLPLECKGCPIIIFRSPPPSKILKEAL